MDFNQLQSVWDNDQSVNIKLPEQLDKLKSANMPIENVRKNMKKDLLAQVITLLAIGLFPLITKLTPTIQLAYYLIYVLGLLVSAYFLCKLYFFYKRLSSASTSTKDNLYETYFDILLNIELYKSFSYSLIPFGLIYMVLLPIGSKYDKIVKFVQHVEKQNLLVIAAVGIIAFFMILMWAMTEAYTKKLYGKYAKEIKKVIDELKEN